jgi:ribose transport system substrate-binding protein
MMLHKKYIREFLICATILAAGGLGLGDARAQSLVDSSSLAKCFVRTSPATIMMPAKHKAPPYKIAFSNSFYGNNWRTEMLNIATAYAKQPEVAKYISSFKIFNSGNDVSQQISQIRGMILSGYDAIVIDAASPTGLDSVINEAARQGIVVVAFDNTVGTTKAINVNEDQTEMGREWAAFLVKHVPANKTILMVRGLAGATVDNDQADGAASVFKDHPDLKLVQVYGDWDVGTNQKVTADALATDHDIGGVWGTEGATGALQGFIQVHAPLVPITGESDNGFMMLAADNKVPALVIGQSPALAAVAIRAAIATLSGQSLPQDASVPLTAVTTDEMKPGGDFFPNLPGSFVTNISIPQCEVHIPVSDVVK